MRVKMPSGVKKVTVIGTGAGPAGATLRGRRVIVPYRSTYRSTDKVKFSVVDSEGRARSGTLHMELGHRKRRSGFLKPVEKRLRSLIRTQHKALGHYLVLHDASSRKRRDGWAKDLGRNVVRVVRRVT